MVAAALLFSTGGALIKATTLSGLAVAGLRCGIAAITLCLLVPGALRAMSWRSWAVGLLYAGSTLCFATSNKLTTAASSIFLQSTAPVYVLVLAPWLLREPSRRRDLAWMTLAVAGLAVIVAGSEPAGVTSPHPALGNLLAVGAGLCWALTLMSLRGLERLPAAPGSAGQVGTAAVIAGNVLGFAISLPALLPWPSLGSTDLWAVGFLGVFQIGLAYFFLTRAMSHVPALDAVILLLIEPVLSPLWSWWIHHEVPGVPTIVGGLLILLSTLGRTWTAPRPATIPAP